MDDKRFNLDHFYSSFPSECFDSLKQLVDICKNVNYAQNNNGFNSNEGIYIMTTTGHYVELLNRIGDLKNLKPNLIMVNTFLSPIKDQSTLDAMVEKKLNWKRSEQPTKIMRKGKYFGNDWFYSWKVKPERNTGVWLLDYQNNEFNIIKNNERILRQESDFKQVTNVKWSLGSEGFEVMKSDGMWASKDLISNGDNLKLSFYNPNGEYILFEIIKNDDKKPGFESITLEKIDKSREFDLPDSKFFELIDEAELLTIKFKDY